MKRFLSNLDATDVCLYAAIGCLFMLLLMLLYDSYFRINELMTNELMTNELAIKAKKSNTLTIQKKGNVNTSFHPISVHVEVSIPSIKSNVSDWYILSASVAGASHIAQDIPCQDSHYHVSIEKGCGIAVVCDGAGSARHPHIGSQYSAWQCSNIIQSLFDDNTLNTNDLPSESAWKNIAYKALFCLYNDLDDYTRKEGLRLESAACTIILLVYVPKGYLIAHIGDGRAAFRDEMGKWNPLIIPYRGEESNETVFLTASIWGEHSSDFIKTHVIETKSDAFALMTDGMENHAFECSHFDTETNEWSDPNIPFEDFFEPVMNTIQTLQKNNIATDVLQQKFEDMLKNGSEKMALEPDDKTLVFGYKES
jgi:hypothetical protein